jgi:CRISPR-associated endonuclease/helicase Cas3
VFAAVFGLAEGTEPTAVQAAAAAAPMPSPLVLEAETGSGKTEAALWRFHRLFAAGEVDSLCFLLPTRVAATAIYERIRGALARLFPEEDTRPNVVLAVPGYLRANGSQGVLREAFEVLWPDDDHADRAIYWAAENSKRFFAAGAVAGTIDQFLLSSMRTRHSHLRGAAVLRAFVVVDEVHASDPYMRGLLRVALARHHAAGGHAMLLSATLTGDARSAFVLAGSPRPLTRRRAREAGANSASGMPRSEATGDRGSLAPYPLLTAPGWTQGLPLPGWNKEVEVELRPLMRDAESVAAVVANAVRTGARVLVIRNTVRQAVATQRAIEHLLGDDHVALFRLAGVVAMHHGRYALPDRQQLDAQVEARFGKQAASDLSPCVLCATQTLEISVDCDADYMVTDLVPMDVLLQRLGRLHRHRVRDSWRPVAHRTARCLILVPDVAIESLLGQGAPRGLGVGDRSAYPDLLSLQCTLEQLVGADRSSPLRLRIPQDNRRLVEAACSAAALDAWVRAAPQGSEWPAHRQRMLGISGAQSGQSAHASVDWLGPWHRATAGELDGDVRTRLGLDGIDVELPSGMVSAFGNPVRQLSVPAWMWAGASLPTSADAPVASDVERIDGGFTFSIGSRRFRYDRLGLAHG